MYYCVSDSTHTQPFVLKYFCSKNVFLPHTCTIQECIVNHTGLGGGGARYANQSLPKTGQCRKGCNGNGRSLDEFL
jgi:hypothetical protein